MAELDENLQKTLVQMAHLAQDFTDENFSVYNTFFEEGYQTLVTLAQKLIATEDPLRGFEHRQKLELLATLPFVEELQNEQEERRELDTTKVHRTWPSGSMRKA